MGLFFATSLMAQTVVKPVAPAPAKPAMPAVAPAKPAAIKVQSGIPRPKLTKVEMIQKRSANANKSADALTRRAQKLEAKGNLADAVVLKRIAALKREEATEWAKLSTSASSATSVSAPATITAPAPAKK